VVSRTDDRTFVGAFQSLDRSIINPWFMGGQAAEGHLIPPTRAELPAGSNGVGRPEQIAGREEQFAQ